MEFFSFLWQGFGEISWQHLVMYLIGAALIYVAIKKEYEPALLLPMGFGAILVNLPLTSAVTQTLSNGEEVTGIIEWLFNVGINASEALPVLLFIGIGAMIDFGPLLSKPILFLFGAAAQLGIFIALIASLLIYPEWGLNEAASVGIIGAADGPTAILVSHQLLEHGSPLIGAIAVAAYSYMALVPIVQPMAIKLITTKKERAITMKYEASSVSKTTRILFPILTTIIVGFIAPSSVSLVGFLMFGNLIRECGVLQTMSETAQNALTNLITLLLGITISFSMRAEEFVTIETLIVMVIGLAAFVFDTFGGILLAKVMNLFAKEKMNPMIGAAGISAFPMASRVAQKMAQEENPGTIIIMHAAGANVAGQIASAIAGGLIIQLVRSIG